MGYLLITLIAGTTAGIEAAIFYLAAYMITTLGAFGVISILSVCERDADNIEDLKGLFWNNPWIASVLTLALLSLAGIPLTAGFISKFYLVLAGVKSGLWLLAFSLVINSVISLYYYLKGNKDNVYRNASQENFKNSNSYESGSVYYSNRHSLPWNIAIISYRAYRYFFFYQLDTSDYYHLIAPGMQHHILFNPVQDEMIK